MGMHLIESQLVSEYGQFHDFNIDILAADDSLVQRVTYVWSQRLWKHVYALLH